jgi:menaquinone-dependent protoporphyrinogen oxidase
MKTLIIYASKHGCAETCSTLLRDKLQGDVILQDIKKGTLPDINHFDKIIIGSSIYVGKAHKEVTEFCQKNLNTLKGKKLGLFICCMLDKNSDLQLNSAFPKELLESAVIKESFGGEFRFGKMNMMEKLAVKMVSKAEKDPISDMKQNISRLSYENINKFADAMNRA